MLGVGQVDLIRQKVLREGWSIRKTASVLGVCRNTVRKYTRGDSEPKRHEKEPRPRPVRDKVEPVIEEILREWGPRTTPKQRVTGTLLHEELVKRGHKVGITVVRDVLRERKRQRMEAFVPLVYRPGDVAQVDFFEVTVDLAGERRKAWKFVMRLMYSGRDFAWIYDRQDQIAFLDGHVRAFEFFGAVPRRIVYDNLRAAVKRVQFPNRELADRFKALVSHCQFEASFARPGEGHDKGGVESRGKTIRLQHLTPIPQAETLREINEALLDALRRQQEPKAARFAEDRAEMLSLPEAPFDPRKREAVAASRRCKVTLEKGTYSVPSRWKCLEVTAYVGVEEVELVCCGESVTRPRAAVKGSVVRYRDFLGELAKKPQAVRQVAPELVEELGQPFGRLWALLVETHGEREGSRTMARVLSAVVKQGEDPIRDALTSALETERVHLLDVEDDHEGKPVPRTTKVPEALAGYEVEAASAADYDELLLESA
ncbi:MAG: IS21 family transposase [Bacteroidetes bacterium]|nr:MAG: IS21 family transposase [Bacteroidota bacterium]